MKIFSQKTSIPLYDEMLINKDRALYEKENKNREIFLIKIKPKDYLKICEKGFKQIGSDYGNWSPEEEKLSSLRESVKDFKSGKSKNFFPIINIEETYRKNFEGTEEEYSFSQEGRHRAIIAMEEGLEEIEVAYFRSTDMKSKIGMDKYVEEHYFDYDLAYYKSKFCRTLKDNDIKYFDFNLIIKRYLDNRLGGFVKYSTEEEKATISLNYFIERQIEEELLLHKKDEIIIDTITHEYGHLIFEILQFFGEDYKIEDFYRDYDDKEFFDFIKNNSEDYISEEEFNSNKEFFEDEYLHLFFEENFSEDFVSFLNLKFSDPKINLFFKNIISTFNSFDVFKEDKIVKIKTLKN